jgi:hypothetical protein
LRHNCGTFSAGRGQLGLIGFQTIASRLTHSFEEIHEIIRVFFFDREDLLHQAA